VVLPGEVGVLVDEKGDLGDRFAVDLVRLGVVRAAVDVEGDVVGVGAEETPTDEDAIVRLADRNDAAVERFHLPLGIRRHSEHQH
jgi:hypothetical protein